MVCIYCSGSTKVINSRHQKRPNRVWRRRKCTTCGNVWSTIETVDYALALAVQQPSGAVEPFLREKLFISIYESCKHRSSALEDAEALTSTVIGKLLGSVQNASLPRHIIISTAAGVLKNFDRTAQVHYTAYHPAQVSSTK